MLDQKIKTNQAKVGVIGLGYVGLPLVLHFAKKGFKSIGFDIKESRVLLVNQGKSYIRDADEQELYKVIKAKKLTATQNLTRLAECDIIQICVPTPVNPNKEPDVSYIVDTSNSILKTLRKGQLIILKSTTFPETTQKIVLPILAKSGLKVGKDFYLAFSPERIDPGNKKFTIGNTPTVVGGITSKCTELAFLLYKTVGCKVISVSSASAAEMAKLLENTFRNVNIALVNELAQLCERMGINIWEVIVAASSKPFGYMPFYPGPGVGGHCIPIDPYYLSWKAREYDFHTSFIELSARINDNMPYYVVDQVIEAISRYGVCPSKSTVLVLGVAFKKDVEDLRDSPSLKLLGLLLRKVGKIYYNDPYVRSIELNNRKYKSVPLTKIREVDCVVIATDHSVYDYKKIVRQSKLVIDTRGATTHIQGGNIVLLGS
ncbi:MAG: nucleotide sugar dehydrogenase [Candidatus Stahlbacteria bacterium]|nr:nucleotide sugar dehydrogenase [Candidatus Stahlbacteria bacterium]